MENNNEAIKPRPHCFVKFGTKEYMESFHKDGLLYCNSMHYFSDLEGERGDYMESAYKLETELVDMNLMEDNGELTYLGVMIMQTAIRRAPDRSLGKLFCMSNVDLTKVQSGIQPLPLNKIFKNDADYCVVIHNVRIFLERLHQCLDSIGIEHEREYIKYFNPKTFNGYKTKFMKPERFKHEQEFRLWFDHNSDVPLCINIKMDDISWLLKSNTILMTDLNSEANKMSIGYIENPD